MKRHKKQNRFKSEQEKALDEVGSMYDPILASQCATYPWFKYIVNQEGQFIRIFVCKKCTFDRPNRRCKHAYVLLLRNDRCEVCGKIDKEEVVIVRQHSLCKECLHQLEKNIKGGEQEWKTF